MQISSFKNEEEIIERANNTNFGLAAAVFTKNVDRMYHMSSALKAGSVWGNCYNILVPQVSPLYTSIYTTFPQVSPLYTSMYTTFYQLGLFLNVKLI